MSDTESTLARLRRCHWSFRSQGRPHVPEPDVCVFCNEPYPCETGRALDVAVAVKSLRDEAGRVYDARPTFVHLKWAIDKVDTALAALDKREAPPT